MAFATDRDILALEPTAFRDLTFAAQTRLTGTIDTNAEIGEFTAGDTDLEQAGVQAGFVVVAAGVPLEVVEVIGATEMTISLLRGTRDGPLVIPPKFTAASAYIATFQPQLETAHRIVMRMAGIDPDAAPAPGAPGVADVVNADALVRLEALCALHLIWAAAGASGGDDAPANQRARMYRQRFDAERQRSAVHLDLNGDGAADAVRRLNAVVLARL